MYISSHLSARVLQTSSCDDTYSSSVPSTEFLIDEIKVPNAPNILVSVVYPPPNTSPITDFEMAFSLNYPLYTNVIIVGDFNADLCKNSYYANHIKLFFFSTDLYIVPYSPTHQIVSSHAWLDICAVYDEDNIVKYG